MSSEENVVVLEEVDEKTSETNENPDLLIIETGDSIKVKQTFDDAIPFVLTEQGGLIQNVHGENFKMIIMVISCIVGLGTQFFPIPFPANRMILGVGCAWYNAHIAIIVYVI